MSIITQAQDSQIEAFRGNVALGTAMRMEYETQQNDADIAQGGKGKSLANTRRCLEGIASRDNSAFSIHYLAARAFDFSEFVNSTKYNGTRCNIYAVKKLATVASVLNGGSFGGDSADSNTVAACIMALAAGDMTGAALNNFVNDKMSAWGKGQQAGKFVNAGTQNGSSLRVLEALGVVERDGARAWKVANPDAFKLLKGAAKRHDTNMNKLVAGAA